MTKEQTGVAKGALSALTVSLLALGLAYYLAFHGINLQFSAPKAIGLISLPLLYCIGHIACLRFSNESIIKGSAYDTTDSILTVDKALLQNTLEQTILAFGAYSILNSVAPAISPALLPVLVALFILGRILFIFGYKYGAGGRAFGFGLTFYPTALTLIATIVYIVIN